MKALERLFGIGRIVQLDENAPSLKELYTRTISIAWPAAVEGALLSIISSVDTIMVGKLGSSAIAAVGLTNQPRMILLILAQSLCVGTTALVARRKGAEDPLGANKSFGQSFGIVTVLGLLMSLIGYFFAEPFMRLAGANQDTLQMSVDYFRIIAMGMLFNYWSLCICASMRAIGHTRITMVTNITANLVNVVFNYFLIGGNCGFPKLGVRGAAMATSFGAFVACVIAFVVAINPHGYLRLRLKHVLNYDRVTLRGLISVGSSSIAETAFLRVGFLLVSKLIAGVGTAAFAAFQIVSQVSALSFTLGDGVATAGASLVGQSLGAKRKDVALAYAAICRKISFVISLMLMAIIFFFRKELPLLFTTEVNIIQDTALAFLIATISILPQNGRVVYSGCLRGAGDVKFVAYVSLISVTVLRPLTTWLLCYPLNQLIPQLQLGITGPWISFFLDSMLRDVMLTRRVHQGRWLDITL